jgi:hypothetical protein
MYTSNLLLLLGGVSGTILIVVFICCYKTKVSTETDEHVSLLSKVDPHIENDTKYILHKPTTSQKPEETFVFISL